MDFNMLAKCRKTTLIPTDSHKSFYGKAIVYTLPKSNGYILKSYDTFVCAYVNGKFHRLWNDYSATTQRHINSFCAFCKIPGMGKAEWTKLPITHLF